MTIVLAQPIDPAPFAAIPGVRVRDAQPTRVRLSAPETAMDGVVKAAATYDVVRPRLSALLVERRDPEARDVGWRACAST